MEIQKDFKELSELFNAHKVQYLIVGGYALAYHGAPRYTGDIETQRSQKRGFGKDSAALRASSVPSAVIKRITL